jgi:hypothetical protein
MTKGRVMDILINFKHNMDLPIGEVLSKMSYLLHK